MCVERKQETENFTYMSIGSVKAANAKEKDNIRKDNIISVIRSNIKKKWRDKPVSFPETNTFNDDHNGQTPHQPMVNAGEEIFLKTCLRKILLQAV